MWHEQCTKREYIKPNRVCECIQYMSQRGRRASHGSHPEQADQNMRARHLWKSLDNNDLNQVSEPSGFHENMGLVGGGGGVPILVASQT